MLAIEKEDSQVSHPMLHKSAELSKIQVLVGRFESHYTKVDGWIKETASENPADLSVALGPNGSYWMWSKTTGSTWHNLPPELVNMFETWPNNRARVSLGFNGSFLYWDDEGEYKFPWPSQHGQVFG